MNQLAIVKSDELEVIQRTAKLLAASGYFATQEGITGMAQVAAKILAGRELGFGPFAAVNGIHIISGKPAVGANLMAAAVRSHPRYDYKVRELSDKACVLEFFDNGESAGLSSFTLADAEKAELSTGKNAATWRKFARNMLFARAMSNGVRWYAPDIFSGNAVYVPEELGAEVDGDGEVIDATVRRVEPSQDVARYGTPAPANPFEDTTPYYVRDWQRLTGKEYDLVKWVATLHDKSDGPCTAKQYQYLTGLVDKLTGSEHNYVLSLLCQAEISSDNMPGRKVTTELLKLLPETIRVKDGQGLDVEEPNPQYRKDICEMLTTFAQRVQPQAA